MTEAEDSCYLNLRFNGVIESYKSMWMMLMIRTKLPALRKALVKREAAGAGYDDR